MHGSTLANLSDSHRIACHSLALASERNNLLSFDSSSHMMKLARLGGCKSAVIGNRVGNSAWGRSMRAKQIVAARWKKKKLKEAAGG